MEIKILEENNYIKIEKDMKDDLNFFNFASKIAIILISIIIFIIFSTINLTALFIVYLLLIVQLFFLFRQIKYIYCNEILELKNNDLILKFIFKNSILYEKKIDFQSVKKIYVVKNIKYGVIGVAFSDNKILSPALEERRRIKILLTNGEIHSWGRNLSDEDSQKIISILSKN